MLSVRCLELAQGVSRWEFKVKAKSRARAVKKRRSDFRGVPSGNERENGAENTALVFGGEVNFWRVL